MKQTSARIVGENRARLALIRLLCAVSVWRTVMTRLLPLCGASAWWTALICLLPGMAVAVLLRLVMEFTRSETLPEAIRATLGRPGAWALELALTLPLLADGLSSITALLTLFTQGVGTRGTQLTLAALTGVMLLFSLHREGLARAVYLLRWVLLAAGSIMAIFALGDARADNLFPLYGEGGTSILAAFRAGLSLAWPLALLLTVPPVSGQGRLRGSLLAVFGAVATILLLTLTIPHELLIRQDGLASLLLLSARYASNALRLMTLSAMMLLFFLAIGASAQLATEHLCSPMKRMPGWLPHAVLVAMLLTQAVEPSLLWAWLGCIEPWLLTPLAVLTLLALPMALLRRNKV